jgi:thymidine kinase
MHTPPDRAAGTGWIEVIAGSMFSGKSEELIRRLRRAEIACQKVQVFKPAIDDRYSSVDVVSHNAQRLACERVSRASDILSLVSSDTQVVGIDEAQFLDMDLVGVCELLANAGVRVVVAGLDQDYRGRPFEPVPQLLAVAEYITKTRAICVRCGQAALRSQRLGESTERVVVGAAESYEPRCRACYRDPEATSTGLFTRQTAEEAASATRRPSRHPGGQRRAAAHRPADAKVSRAASRRRVRVQEARPRRRPERDAVPRRQVRAARGRQGS